MTFKRMMALGAVAAALAFTGCRDRSQSEQDLGARPADQTQPATGGSGTVDSAIPGSSDTIGGTRQDDRPGTELGGTGATGSDAVAPPAGDLDQDNRDPNKLDQRNQLDAPNNIGGSDEGAR